MGFPARLHNNGRAGKPILQRSTPMSEQSYPLFHAAGTPRELGRLHGEQAQDRIGGFLDYLCASLKLSTSSLRTGQPI